MSFPKRQTTKQIVCDLNSFFATQSPINMKFLIYKFIFKGSEKVNKKLVSHFTTVHFFEKF